MYFRGHQTRRPGVTGQSEGRLARGQNTVSGYGGTADVGLFVSNGIYKVVVVVAAVVLVIVAVVLVIVVAVVVVVVVVV